MDRQNSYPSEKSLYPAMPMTVKELPQEMRPREEFLRRGERDTHCSRVEFAREALEDADDFDVVGEVLHSSAEHHAADAAKTVDAKLDRHVCLSFFLMPVAG